MLNEEKKQSAKNKKGILPFFIPHLGCNYDCIFCDQKQITGQNKGPSKKDIIKAIAKYPNLELAFYGGSFTALSFSQQKYYLQIAYEALKAGKISGIRISTRPDFLKPIHLDLLKSYGVKNIEVGVQSLDDEVLKMAQRGHDALAVKEALINLRAYDFNFGVQLMPGLPGDNAQKSIRSTWNLLDSGASMARIYPTLVLEKTPLANLYNKKLYEPLTLDAAVELSAQMFILFKQANINVIRIGLQNTKNIAWYKSVIAGPFHPAFGQLVKSFLWRKKMELLFLELANFKNSQIKNLNNKSFIIYVNSNDIEDAIGHKKNNLLWFKEKLGLNIKIKKASLDYKSAALQELSKEAQYNFVQKKQLILTEDVFIEKYLEKIKIDLK